MFFEGFKCSNGGCGRIYRNRSSLTRHLKFECGMPPKYECMLCEKRCALKSNLKQHMVAVHMIFPRWRDNAATQEVLWNVHSIYTRVHILYTHPRTLFFCPYFSWRRQVLGPANTVVFEPIRWITLYANLSVYSVSKWSLNAYFDMSVHIKS